MPPASTTLICALGSSEMASAVPSSSALTLAVVSTNSMMEEVVDPPDLRPK